VFLIQWIFLGDLRSAVIVSMNIPFALFFAIILLVLQGQDANLLSIGAVDFGIIIDSAVILVENIFRNHAATAGSAHAADRGRCTRSTYGSRSHAQDAGLDQSPAHDLRVGAAGRQRDSVLDVRSRSPPSVRCSSCRASRARFSGPWRVPMRTRSRAR
jgi:hypothetical protein